MKSVRFLSFALAATTLVFSGCQSSPTRTPSSTTTASTSSSSVPFDESKWKVALHNGEKNNWQVGDLALTTYSLETPVGLRDFESRLQEIEKENKTAKKLAKSKKEPKDKKEKKTAKKKAKGFLDKSGELSVTLMLDLVDKLKAPTLTASQHNEALAQIAEIAASFNYNFAYPIRQHYWIAEAPFAIAGALHHGTMTEVAKPSIDVLALKKLDSSLVDPPASSFWKSPGEISRKNLYYGFGRTSLMEAKGICVYDAPKTGYGTHGGFKLTCGEDHYRIKFGDEGKKEPFIARITWALGYNATPVDYTNGLKIAYDRKIISEFNSRKKLDMELRSLFGFDYAKVHLQKYRQPFEVAIAGAVLKNGQKISSSDLRTRLLKVREDHSEQVDANYDEKFESTINYLVLNEGNLAGDSSDEETLGPWSWNDFDRGDRRAYRGFGIYSGFLNMFDARLNNNRLRVRKNDDGQIELVHYVSDLGSGLGKGTSVFASINGLPNQFGWEFMRRGSGMNDAYSLGQSNEDFDDKVQILEFHPLESNVPFRRAQIDDAKWMAHKLAQLSEQQFTDALIASGYDACEVKLYIEKFLSRRSSMMKALGLDRALPEPRAFDQHLNYDPAKDALPVASDGAKRVLPPVGNSVIVRGKIEPRS